MEGSEQELGEFNSANPLTILTRKIVVNSNLGFCPNLLKKF